MGSRCLSVTGVRFSVILRPARNWALLTVGLPTQDGSDLDGVSAFRTHEQRPGRAPSIPGDHGAHPDRWRLTAGIAASQRPVLHPAPTSHRAGPALNEASTRVQAIRPSGLPQPVTARMERAALGPEPRASYPADQEPDDACRGGDRSSSTDLELPLNSHPSISNPVVHSMRATSRRTSP